MKQDIRHLDEILQATLDRLGEIDLYDRNRATIKAALEDAYQNGGLDIEALRIHGFGDKFPVNDSYGRDPILPSAGFTIPEEIEPLTVGVRVGYEPAIHTHGPGTGGAHLLALSNEFFNVDYRWDNEVLVHKGVQLIREGEVAFVPGTHKGIHRVVSAGDEDSVSLNIYWDNGNLEVPVGTDAHVFDFLPGKGTRVTTGGPAFFFPDPSNPNIRDWQDGFKASALVQLEDLVGQHFQLATSRAHGQLPPEREALLEHIENDLIRGPEATRIYNQAIPQAKRLVEQAKMRGARSEAATAQYVDMLFVRAAELTGRDNPPRFSKDTELGMAI